MKVTGDEPGRLLLIEGRPPQLPDGLVGGVVGGLIGGLLAAAGAGATDRLWRPSLVRADRAAQTLEIEERSLSGESRRTSIPRSRIRAVNIRTRFWRHASDKAQTVAPGSGAFDLTVHEETGETRLIPMDVDDIDTRERLVRLTYGLGAALDLSYQRVVQNDPRRIQIELVSEPGPGTTPVPVFEGIDSPIDLSAISEEIVPSFDQGGFRSDFKVAAWRLGDAVRFEKPPEKGFVFGCLPFVVVGVLAGPAMFALTREWVPTIFLTIGGLMAAFLAGTVVVASLPRSTRISWPERTVTVGGWFKRRTIPMDQLAALELRCVRTYHSTKHRSYNSYRCDILAHAQGESQPLEFVATESFTEDPESPYDLALPLVAALARALGIKRRVTEYE